MSFVFDFYSVLRAFLFSQIARVLKQKIRLETYDTCNRILKEPQDTIGVKCFEAAYSGGNR